jgi:hypothetical protein
MFARRAALFGSCLGLLLEVSSVCAQPPPDQPVILDESAALAYEPAYKAAAPTPVSLELHEHKPSRWRRSPFGSFDIGVPIVLDNDPDLIRPGANLHAQGGIDIGYLSFFAHGGWRWIPVDFDRAAKNGHPEYEGEGRDPLKNPYFGLGLRAQVPNDTPLLPYLSASFDFNFWNFRESDRACAGGYYYWYCANSSVYRFTPGFSGRVGTSVDLKRGINIDFGLGASMSFKGDFFDRSEVWLEPYAGVGYRR